MARSKRKMTDNPVVCRIVGVLKEKKKSEKSLTDFLGISSGSVSKWKYEGRPLYLRYIRQICDFLGTSPNYLFYGKEDLSDRMTHMEREIIHMYRNLDEGKRKCIRDTLKYFSENKKENRQERNVVKDENAEKPLL